VSEEKRERGKAEKGGGGEERLEIARKRSSGTAGGFTGC